MSENPYFIRQKGLLTAMLKYGKKIEKQGFSALCQIRHSADDFRKIDPSGRAGMLFDAIPAEFHKNASRYQVSSVIAGEKEDRVREILADMQDSMTVNITSRR
ncbi:MAG: hypothetical protein LUG99_17250 [Lachnospiraceae bacterium]|nr:hypothetical protein [Lachnospiraceae bacterium]